VSSGVSGRHGICELQQSVSPSGAVRLRDNSIDRLLGLDRRHRVTRQPGRAVFAPDGYLNITTRNY